MSSISDNRVNISNDNPSIVFDKSRCDECGICKNICKFNVGVYGYSDDDYPCINCGSCTIMCPHKCLSERDEIDKLRHSATASLFETRDVIVVASVSCIYGLGDPIDYENLTISLRPCQNIDQSPSLNPLIIPATTSIIPTNKSTRPLTAFAIKSIAPTNIGDNNSQKPSQIVFNTSTAADISSLKSSSQ